MGAIDPNSFWDAIWSWYFAPITLLFVLHNAAWIVFGSVAAWALTTRPAVPVNGLNSVFVWTVAFTVVDGAFHVVRFFVSMLFYVCYADLFGGDRAPEPNAIVLSKRTGPYNFKLILSIVLTALFWKQYSVIATQAVPIESGDDIYSRYVVLLFLVFYGAVQSAWALLSTTPYYLFQRNLGILTKKPHFRFGTSVNPYEVVV